MEKYSTVLRTTVEAAYTGGGEYVKSFLLKQYFGVNNVAPTNNDLANLRFRSVTTRVPVLRILLYL